ncbi:MAG: T9SS type A sorting domain-containing protein [Chitinophagaceae bacterium]|nr:MAG: T9SS type A sorting domain-containing protein [Chitinophagaceae bacterium]
MKKITFCFALLLLTFFGGQAQVQLGDGTAIEKGVPFEPGNPYSYAQSIYLSSEILATGEITSLQWYFAGEGTLEGSQQLTIYLGNTSKSAFASATDWEPIANLTEVYSGGIAADGPGWVTVYLDIPFSYNGTSNLVIAVKDDSEGMDSYLDHFYAYEVTGDRSITYASWSEAVDTESPEEGTTKNFVPNIVLTGINQACPKPSNLLAEEPTTTSINLSWNSNAVATGGSQYYISTSSTAPLATTEPTGSIASGEVAVVNTGLLPATKYYVWVRDICESGNGTWSNMASFITDCVPTDSFFQNFNTASNGVVPICWSTIIYNANSNTSPADVTITSEDGYTGKSVQFYRNGDATSDLILVSPPISNLSANTHRLKFFAKHSAFTQAGGFRIGTIDGNGIDANFTQVGQMTTTNTFKEYIIDFTQVGTTGDTHIAIKLNSTDDNFLGYIDNIRWEATPLCVDVSNVIVPAATTTTATVAWTSDEEVTSWEVVYSESSTADPASLIPIITVTDEPTTTLTGLTAETNYSVWVRSACDGLAYWVGPINFSTACQPIISINEDFESTTATNLPNCWSKILRGETLSLYATIRAGYNDTANSGENSVHFYTGFPNSSPTDDLIVVTPNLGNLAAGTHRLKFFAKGGGNVQIGTLAGNTISAEFNYFDDVTVSNTGMTEYVFEFSSYDGTDTYIGIRYNVSSSNQNLYIDDVVWEPIPACPDVTEIDAVALDTTTLAVGWATDGATQWQTAYGLTSVTDPNNATISEILTIPSTEISGLTSNTTYKLWVRAVCGEPDGNGAWIGPILATTPCSAVNEFNETFEAANAPALPSCWSSIANGANIDIDGGAGSTVITWQPFAGTKGIEMYNAGSASEDNIILATPVLGNLAAGTHRLKFHAAYLVASGNLEIGTVDGEGNFNFVEDITLTGTYEEYIVNFSSYTGTDNRIGIRMNSVDTYSPIGLDNIIWEMDPELSNGEFDNSKFTLYPNPVKNVLNLSYNQNISGVSVFNILGQKVYENTFNSNSAQVDMAGFATGSYIVKVISENQTKVIKVIKE